MKIYIAGPYSNGDPVENTNNAIDAAEKIAALGHTPFIPHLTHYWHMRHPHPYVFWINQDIEWLFLCDALLRLPGESGGADGEEEYARFSNMPVYHDVSEIPKWSQDITLGTANSDTVRQIGET